jgi:LytS/YehU family sensor histidine kinase
LNDEINIVNNYCFLQKSRFGDNLLLNIDVPEDFGNYALPKLSLQMLVENAIKHNIISDEKPLHIRIYIKNDEYIVVENNLQKRIEEKSTRLGLANIRKRYKFLSAKDILIHEKNSTFIVELPLLTISTR